MQTKINQLRALVQHKFMNEATGHDWYHIDRVVKNALLIQEHEGGDRTIIEITALLHDIDDHKFNGGDMDAGALTAKKIMQDFQFDENQINHIVSNIQKISYKGALVTSIPTTLEGKIVQDADRLDAIGAIGIARAFAYGGNKNRPIYDPTDKPELHATTEAYIHAKSHTINHFYEKLLLLKEKINTPTGLKLAEERHDFMVSFLEQFYKEWDVVE
jgi:uncharacterized protein